MIGRISINKHGDLIIRIPADQLRDDEPIPQSMEGVGLLVKRPKLHVVVPLLDSSIECKKIGPICPLHDGFFGFPADIVSAPPMLFDLLSVPMTIIRLMERQLSNMHSFVDQLRDFGFLTPPAFASNLNSLISGSTSGRSKYSRYKFIAVRGRRALLAETIVNNIKTHILIGDGSDDAVYAGVAKRNNKTVAYILIAGFSDITACKDYFSENYGYDSLQLRRYDAKKFMHELKKFLSD